MLDVHCLADHQDRCHRAERLLMESGNQLARLRKRDDVLFDLELRLPNALAHLAKRIESTPGVVIPCIDLRGSPSTTAKMQSKVRSPAASQ
jgi:hypothetical protein